MPDIFVDKNTDPKPPAPERLPSHGVKPDESYSEMKAEKDLVKDLKLTPENGTHFHLFSSYCEDPSDIKFINSVDNEILLLFLRRHFITNLPWILKAVALALIPVLFEIVASLGYISGNFVDPAGKVVVYSFYYFFILSGYIFVNYITWFYNISIVTNLRIVDIDFTQLIFENVAATKLSQLEDVNYAQIGIVRSVFDYGDVFLQTAGTTSNFEFLAVPHPERVIRVINNLIGNKSK